MGVQGSYGFRVVGFLGFRVFWGLGFRDSGLFRVKGVSQSSVLYPRDSDRCSAQVTQGVDSLECGRWQRSWDGGSRLGEDRNNNA